jgi:NAD(P)-dependent dehydrogenase (short-subunit alcohol dehydrogenase family)
VQEVWFVTGVSSGLGRAMAIAALDAGHRVVGTVRKDVDLKTFESTFPGRAIGVKLDVSDHAAIRPLVDRIEREIGSINVVINNAGYGQEGPIESISIEDFRRLYDANLFGAIGVIQAVLPYMRARKSGRIINISSITAVVAAPAIGAYSSTKAAMNCISEVLAKEVASFGIKVTAILPGSFRTDWAGRSLVRTEDAEGEYAHLSEQREARARRNGTQPGDPAKFAAAVLDLVESEDPPVNLLLGDSTVRAYHARIDSMQQELKHYATTAPSTDFSNP